MIIYRTAFPFREWCPGCEAYREFRSKEGHTRRRGDNGDQHVAHERIKLCNTCDEQVRTIELPDYMLPEYGRRLAEAEADLEALS